MKHVKEIVPVILPREVVTGTAKAPVSIVMFGDYESEACSKANEAVTTLLEEFDGQVNFTFRHFPLTRHHQKAHKAAEAAIGAAQEGKFWEMHNILFQNRKNLGTISLKSYAREAGAKDKKFLDNLINSSWGWYVQDDLKEGMSKGVTSIPAFFINGKRVEKEPSYKNLKATVTEELAGEIPAVISIKQMKSA